jgi:hypothetical protein
MAGNRNQSNQKNSNEKQNKNMNSPRNSGSGEKGEGTKMPGRDARTPVAGKEKKNNNQRK